MTHLLALPRQTRVWFWTAAVYDWWGNANELLCRNRKWQSLMFPVPWFLWFFFWSPFSLNDHSVCCLWFVSNFRFCFAEHCVVWLGDDVPLLEKSRSFSDSLRCPSTWPNLWSPGFLSSPDVSALMTSHPRVRHPLGCWICLGFLRGLCGRSFHGADCLMGMWHLCVLQLLEPKILWNCFWDAPHFSTKQKLCPLTSIWGGGGGVECPVAFICASDKASISSVSPTGLALHCHWLTSGRAHSLSAPPSKTHFQSMFAAFPFFSLLCLWSWF